MVHSAAGRIVPVKNSGETVRNLTRDFPACSTVLITSTILNILVHTPLLCVMHAHLFLKTDMISAFKVYSCTQLHLYIVLYILFICS